MTIDLDKLESAAREHQDWTEVENRTVLALIAEIRRLRAGLSGAANLIEVLVEGTDCLDRDDARDALAGFRKLVTPAAP